MFYIIIALLLVLLVVWIGVNAAYFRKHDTASTKNKQREPAEIAKPAQAQADGPDERPAAEYAPAESVPESRPHAAMEVSTVEPPAKHPAGVFRGRDASYVLHAVNVPLFTEENWLTAFKRLKEDDRVLGWAAFHEDRLGAADRTYEQEFIDALRQHHRATERLRRQAGLSHVSETTIVGDEGKVWFLTVLDDAWFALFIERDEDGMQLASELLAPVRSDNPDKTMPGRA